MIKYRVKGNFISEKDNVYNLCSDYFLDYENPYTARKRAITYFNNFIDLLNNDFNIDFESTFKKKRKLKIGGNSFEIEDKYAITIQFTINSVDFFEIDFFGIVENNFYDNIALGLEIEFDYYKEKKYNYNNSQTITYCNIGEWTEGFTENEPNSFKILETSVDFSDKKNPFWWLTIIEKKELVKTVFEKHKIEKSFKYGENNFIEFKPSLLYNFKTNRASIGIKNIIAKVVCSFLNSNGGKILIGINDKGEIQGLDYDFSLKTKENEFDFFRNEFDNLLFQFFDKTVFNYIKAEFNLNYEKPIFEISIKPSSTAVFLINKKENSKEFYIRTNTSSIEINDIEEIVRYCLTHFKQKP